MNVDVGFPRLFPPAEITPESLAELARVARLRWTGSARVSTYPGWAYADFLLLAEVLDAAAIALGSQTHKNKAP